MNQDDRNYENADLSGMLKNSRPSVEFEEYKDIRPYYGEDAGDSKMIRLVIKHSGGLIKDGKQASFVLLGFAVAAIIVSIFLFFGRGRVNKTPSEEEIFRVTPPLKILPASS